MKKTYYKSGTLQELHELIAQLHKTGIFPSGHITVIAAKRGHDRNIIANALIGRHAAMDALRSIIEEAEHLTSTRTKKASPQKVRHLSIPDLYHQGLLPNSYSEIVAKKTGMKPNAVRYFVKNQLAGKAAYASSDNTKEALYEIAEMNEEWELLCRAENIIQKIA